MKTYNVVWQESHSVNVQAKNADDACEKVMQGEFDTANESAEITSPAEAYLMPALN